MDQHYVYLRDYDAFPDWSVWFSASYLIATYDGMHTVFDRLTGQELYHGGSLDAARAAIGLPGETMGESYATGY